MQTYRVELGERSYPIYIGTGLLENADLILPVLPQKRVVVVTNETIAPLYLHKLKDALNSNGVRTLEIELPDGEQYKSWETLGKIYDSLLSAKCERGTTLLALGGGVVGDITGFAAATYLRGVPYIQIPTTLLSQVDSSIGGKTAINHPLGKNMIGAFYQPRLVLADMSTLLTLPEREFKSGLAEIVKHGLIRDASLVAWIEKNVDQLLARDMDALSHVVLRSCEIKGAVVESDEREVGDRALLNFGHTFGHAIESGMGYGQWLHGEAVAAGMVLAADLSMRLGMISVELAVRIRQLIQRIGLPVEVGGLSASRMLDLMAMDKKAKDGRLRFILLDGLGSARIRADVPIETVSKVLSQLN